MAAKLSLTMDPACKTKHQPDDKTHIHHHATLGRTPKRVKTP